MLANRQSEVCERNTRVDVRAGCAHCSSERVPGGATRHPSSIVWSGLTRIEAHRHCGPTSASSSHMHRILKIANGCQAWYHRSWCAGAAMHGHRTTGVRKLSRKC